MTMTEAAIEPEASTEKRRWGGLVWLMVILGLVLVAVAAFRVMAVQRLAAQVEVMRAAGLPTTPQELDDSYPAVADPAMNAGLVILETVREIEAHEGYAATKESRESDSFWWSWDGQARLTDEELAVLDGGLGSLTKELAALRAAPQLPESRYPVDLSAGVAAALPHMQEVRQGARILRYDAMLAVHQGDFERAVQDVVGIFDIAETMADEPTLISGLMRIACDATGWRTLQGVVNQHDLTPAQRQLVLARLERAAAGTPARLGLAGEAACLRDTFGQLFGGAGTSLGLTGAAGGSAVVPRKILFQIYAGVGMADVEAAYGLEYLLAAREMAGVTDPVERRRLQSAPPLGTPIPKYYLGCRLILPAIDSTAEKELSWRTELRVIRQALAPGTQLLDPFTGKPIEEKVVDGRRYVYSFGPNGVDDGVFVEKAERRGKSDDKVFVVPVRSGE